MTPQKVTATLRSPIQRIGDRASPVTFGCPEQSTRSGRVKGDRDTLAAPPVTCSAKGDRASPPLEGGHRVTLASGSPGQRQISIQGRVIIATPD